MLVVSILGMEFKLFIVNSLIESSICVLVECSGFRGAKSPHKLLVELWIIYDAICRLISRCEIDVIFSI